MCLDITQQTRIGAEQLVKAAQGFRQRRQTAYRYSAAGEEQKEFEISKKKRIIE